MTRADVGAHVLSAQEKDIKLKTVGALKLKLREQRMTKESLKELKRKKKES